MEVQTQLNQSHVVSVFPNPANAQTTLRYYLSTQEDVQIELLDLSGKVIKQMALGAHAAGYHVQTLETEQIPAGVYLVRMVVSKRYLPPLKVVISHRF